MLTKALSNASFAIRLLLTTAGAIALLYTFSYPYSIIQPSMAWDNMEELPPEFWQKGFQAMLATLTAPLNMVFPWYRIPVAEGVSPDAFIPWLWIAPWLFMELASSLGGKRDLVWFGSIGLAILISLVAWPLLHVTHPEYIQQAVVGDDCKLPIGLLKLALFIFVSVIFRLGLLRYLFHRHEQDTEDSLIYADADVLDPSKARTVKEIAADKDKTNAKFKFRKADEGIISAFRALMAELLHKRFKLVVKTGVGLLLLAAWCMFFPRPTEEEAVQRDIADMFEPVPYGNKQGDRLVSTQAVHSALRVFTYMANDGKNLFLGKDDGYILQWLGLDKADPAFVRQMRSGTVRTAFAMKDDGRFLTLSDGIRTAILLVRHGEDGKISNVEIQYVGWNARADKNTLAKWYAIRARSRNNL